jgi:TolB protein
MVQILFYEEPFLLANRVDFSILSAFVEIFLMLHGVVNLLVLACLSIGPAAPYEVKPDQTPQADWTAAESRFLGHERQLTDPDMGLTASGEAYFSPDTRRIIFQATPKGQTEYQMFTLELAADGTAIRSSLKQVSPGGGACTCGWFRPDGKGITFASSYLHPDMPNPNEYHRKDSSYTWKMPGGMDIFAADLDGKHLKNMTDVKGYDAEGSFSPDGKKFVFTSDRAGNPDIYVMNADGSGVKQLTDKPGYDGGPFFSPDGKRIIFRSDRKGDDHLQIFVMNADGTGEKQLTAHSDIVNWAPYWHPNGHTLIFTSSVHGHQNYELYLLNIDTGKMQRVTYKNRFDGLPVFSPDGKKVMWTSKRGPDNTSQIFIADFKLPEGF